MESTVFSVLDAQKTADFALPHKEEKDRVEETPVIVQLKQVKTPAIWVMSSALPEIPSGPAVTKESVGMAKVVGEPQPVTPLHGSAVVSVRL